MAGARRKWITWTHLGWAAAAITMTHAPIAAGQSRCGSANWACVAECIDVRCIEQCLSDSCDQRLRALRACTRQKGCSGEDPSCAKEQCAEACRAAFDPATGPGAEPNLSPCAGRPGLAGFPGRLVGGWNLVAATLGERDRFGESSTPEPRPDYEKVLKVDASGCFTLETKLEDATLGQGNLLVVRSWGRLAVTTDARDDDKHTARFDTEGAQAVGHTCGHQRATALPTAAFKRPRYRLELEADKLTLSSLDPEGQTFQFRKGTPKALDQGQ